MRDEFITLQEAAALAPSRPSYLSVWRWARVGCRVSGSEERIRLRHARYGGSIYTTKQWLDEFAEALAEADMQRFGPARRPKRQRLKGSKQELAKESLREAGILDE